jgi:hypothetical protein
MSSIRVSGNTSGHYDLTVPDVAGSNTIALDKIVVADSNGFVGIGTTTAYSASTDFEVKATDPKIVINNTGQRAFGLLASGTKLHIRDESDNQDLVTITEGGNVGIGYTGPNEKLHVNGYIEASSGFKLAGHPVLTYDGFDGGYATRLGSTGTSTLNATQIFAGGSVQATFKGGNVGIGTDNPGYKLQVNGDLDILNVKGSLGNAFVRFTDGDATADFSIGADDGSGAGAGAFILYDRSNSAYRLVVNSSGNVGIGTTSPQKKLEVRTGNGELSHFGSNSANAVGNYTGISLGYAENGNSAYRKVGIVSVGRGDGAARQDLAFLVDSNADGGSAQLADTKMKISHEGYVTMPNQPAFSYLGSKSYTISTTGTQTMTGGNVWSSSVNHAFNNGGHFNAGNGRFTAPVAGKYHFQFQCMASDFGSGYLWFYMDINSTTKSYMQFNQQTNRMPIVHHMYCNLSVNDYVTCLWTNNYVSGQIHYPGFSGALIG